MKCSAPIDLSPTVVTYCVKELTERDSSGKLTHKGRCEPEKPPGSMFYLLKVWWDKHGGAQ